MAYKIQNNKDYLQVDVKKFINDFIYRIDIDADYQRENVWSTKQQEDLLDSILKGIDIPKMYLAEVENNKQFDYECVDGKQRMLTLLSFFKPDPGVKNPLSVEINGRHFTYQKLKLEHPNFAKQIEDYQLDFVTYKKDFLEDHDSNFVKLIFRRLQLGKSLNSGEILHAHYGPIKEFIFKDIGSTGPFIRNTNLSSKRFSREFALAQICFNSVKYNENGEYERARLIDLEDFFENPPHDLNNHFRRIKEALQAMDKNFGENAKNISSRAVAVSAYLFVEKLFLDDKNLISQFAEFYIKLLDDIKRNSQILSKYNNPQNRLIMEQFQKYISQASVEPYSIKKRDEFLKRAFDYYLDPKTKGKIIGDDS